MGKCKIPDSELVEKLRDDYKSYYAVAKAVGLNCNTDFIKRCHRLEELYGIPERIPSRKGRPPIRGKVARPEKRVEPAKEPKPQKPEPKPIMVEMFLNRPKEQVYYKDRLCTVISVVPNKMTLRREADMKLITLTMEEYAKNPEILRGIDEKPPIKTVGEAIVKQRDEGATYLQDVETVQKFKPFDLEMDDTTESVKDFGPLFDDVDYIDDAWLKPTARKLSIKEKIKRIAIILFGEVGK